MVEYICPFCGKKSKGEKKHFYHTNKEHKKEIESMSRRMQRFRDR